MVAAPNRVGVDEVIHGGVVLVNASLNERNAKRAGVELVRGFRGAAEDADVMNTE